MTLLDIISELETLNLDKTIYAVKPWSLESKAVLIDEDGELTKYIDGIMYEYFLEVFIASEIQEDLSSLTNQALCHKVILYAENDA